MNILHCRRPLRLFFAFALFFLYAQSFFAQTLSLTEFELELKGREDGDSSLGLAGTLKAGAAASFGSHFNLSAGAEISSSDIRSLFAINEESRTSASIKITAIAMEFPFSAGWSFTPAVFLGEYTDVASGALLSKALKVKMRPPEFLRYGALSVFSTETNTQGLGGGFAWSAKKHPVAVAAYGTWNGETETAGFNAYVQAAGTLSGLSWNIFAVFGRGEEDNAASLRADDFYMSGGFSASVEGEGNLSLYMQAKVLPFRLGSSNYFTENIENRLHLFFEPRYRGRFFAASAAFFLSPVMQEKDIPFLDLEEGVLYAGTNIMLEVGGLASGGKSFGFNVALFADANSVTADWGDILRICVSPFFKIEGDVFTFTASAFLNMSKISSPLSAGEINLHIEAAL